MRAERSRWWNPDWDSDTSLQESAQSALYDRQNGSLRRPILGLPVKRHRKVRARCWPIWWRAPLKCWLVESRRDKKNKEPRTPVPLEPCSLRRQLGMQACPAQGHIFTILYNLVVTTTDQVGPDGDACGVATAGQNMRLTAGPDRPPGGPAYAAASAASV